MAKIVLISCVAPPEPVVAGRVNYDIANLFASKGHEVWLLSPKPSRPLGFKYSHNQLASNLPITVKRIFLNSFTYPNYSLFFRTIESISFGINSMLYINKHIKDYDIIYATPWPFFGQLISVILKKKNKILIMNVQDLYPESFWNKISHHKIRKLLQPLLFIDKYIAKKSTHITVVSEYMKKVYETSRQVPIHKVSVINNWQDEEVFLQTSLNKNKLLLKFDLEETKDNFKFMYLGNIGPVAGVESLISSFYKLNDKSSSLIVAGSGSSKQNCRTLVEKFNLNNVHFLEVPSGLTSVVEIQSLADVLLLPIKQDASKSSVPSKLIAYMFSSKPIITSASKGSATGKAVLESRCGWILDGNSDEKWCDMFRIAISTPKNKLKIMGSEGFGYAMINYSKEQGLKKINGIFENYLKRITV